MYTVKIENVYEDGHKATHEAQVRPPADGQELEDWFEHVVWDHTGDGYGMGFGGPLGYCYTATIIAADDADHIGKEHEWTGR